MRSTFPSYNEMEIEFLRLLRLLPLATEPPDSATKHSLSPNSPLSDPPPPLKRRRTSESDSSLSDPDDEDDEDQPLASRIPRSSGSVPNGMNGKRSGKKLNGKTVGGKKGPPPTSLGLPSEQPHSASEGAAMNGRVNGIVPPDPPVKVEVDDKQLSRLATGVTVDTGMNATQTPVSREFSFRPSFHSCIQTCRPQQGPRKRCTGSFDKDLSE